MCVSSAAVFPWTAVVGIAGILGTIGGVYLTNRAAERRLRAQQEHEDLTRFHKDRVELYAKLLGAVQSCRHAAATIQLLPPDKRKEYGERGDYEPFKAAVAELSTANNAVQLVASQSVRDAALSLVGDAALLAVVASADRQKFDSLNQKLAQSESDFSAAAREELLPKEGSAP